LCTRICQKEYNEYSTSEGNTVTTNNNLLCISSCYSSSNLDSVLSTVTFGLPDGKEFRALKDTGSQISLVSDEILNFANHKILEKNLKLNITGINGDKVTNLI